MNQYNTLVNDIKNLGIQAGMVVFLHSSFKSLGFDGTPQEVIQAFQEVLTKEGTLLLPALSYKTVNKDHLVFHYYDTPSCVGALSEAFRQSADVKRSLNPIHSVCAWGKLQDTFTKDHELDKITLGKHSPYKKMLEHNAKICMLGCSLKPNTFMHYVENENHVPYREIKYKVHMQITDASHNTFTKEVHLPDMSNYIQRYDRLQGLLTPPFLNEGKVLQAKTYLLDANEVFRVGSSALKTNPFYFVDTISTI